MNTQKYLGWLLFVVLLAIGTSCSRQAPVADVEVIAPEGEIKSNPESEQCRNEKANIARLEEGVAEFARLPTQSQLTDQPYLKGKILLLERYGEDEYSYDARITRNDYSPGCRDRSAEPDAYEAVRARSPEDVQTVVLTVCKKAQTAEYIVEGERVPASTYNCDLTIVDHTIPAIIYKKRFEAEKLKPNETVTSPAGIPVLSIMKTPEDEMAKFLLDLPRL